MAERRWVGLGVATRDQQQKKAPLPRVKDWRRFFRLRYLHLRREFDHEPLVIENCARGLEAESSSGMVKSQASDNDDDLPDGIVWRLRCPIGPSKLQSTNDPRVDFCRECKRNVYWVVDEIELRQKVQRGECVYYDPGGRHGLARGKGVSCRVLGRFSTHIDATPSQAHTNVITHENFYGRSDPPRPPPPPVALARQRTTSLWHSDGSARGYRYRTDEGRWEDEENPLAATAAVNCEQCDVGDEQASVARPASSTRKPPDGTGTWPRWRWQWQWRRRR